MFLKVALQDLALLIFTFLPFVLSLILCFLLPEQFCDSYYEIHLQFNVLKELHFLKNQGDMMQQPYRFHFFYNNSLTERFKSTIDLVRTKVAKKSKEAINLSNQFKER